MSSRVRMGLHTGGPRSRVTRTLGIDVSRAARISAAAHGGQILLSQTTRKRGRGSRSAGSRCLLAGRSCRSGADLPVCRSRSAERLSAASGHRTAGAGCGPSSLSLRRPAWKKPGGKGHRCSRRWRNRCKSRSRGWRRAVHRPPCGDGRRSLPRRGRPQTASPAARRAARACSPVAARSCHADSLAAQIAGIERIAECRRTLADVARTLGAQEMPPQKLGSLRSANESQALPPETDKTLNQAARTLDPWATGSDARATAASTTHANATSPLTSTKTAVTAGSSSKHGTGPRLQKGAATFNKDRDRVHTRERTAQGRRIREAAEAAADCREPPAETRQATSIVRVTRPSEPAGAATG